MLVAGLCSLPVLAQTTVRPAAVGAGAAAGRERDVLRIKRFPKPGRGLIVRSPEYNTSVGRSASNRKPREWVLFETIYDTAPEWMDTLDFAYSVMTERRTPDGKKEYGFFQVSVRYLDVAKGEHTSCVVLPPNAIARYGEPVAIAVEIAQDGKLLASQSEATMAGLPDDWWKNARVLDNPGVIRREGYLADRSKTPFALVNIDDYEVVK
jgi:hypothetical protein